MYYRSLFFFFLLFPPSFKNIQVKVYFLNNVEEVYSIEEECVSCIKKCVIDTIFSLCMTF